MPLDGFGDPPPLPASAAHPAHDRPVRSSPGDRKSDSVFDQHFTCKPQGPLAFSTRSRTVHDVPLSGTFGVTQKTMARTLRGRRPGLLFSTPAEAPDPGRRNSPFVTQVDGCRLPPTARRHRKAPFIGDARIRRPGAGPKPSGSCSHCRSGPANSIKRSAILHDAPGSHSTGSRFSRRARTRLAAAFSEPPRPCTSGL